MISKNQIKFVKSLHQKKNRIEHRCFIVESTKNVLEILSSDYEIVQLFATKTWIELNSVDVKVSVNEVVEKEMSRISALKTASEVLVVMRMKEKTEKMSFEGVNIMLDDVRDPGNLGTLIRICDWFAVKNIYLSTNSVDMYNPKVVQSTMGSLQRVNVVYADLVNLLDSLGKEVDVFAAVMNGENIKNIKVNNNSLFVFGNESKGISEDILSKIENRITINKFGNAESLNVSVAAAIILNQFCN